jgi:hypothetical protein
MDNYYTSLEPAQTEGSNKQKRKGHQVGNNYYESGGSKYKDNGKKMDCAYRPHELAAPRPRPRTTPIHPRSRSRSTEDDGPRGTPANDPGP